MTRKDFEAIARALKNTGASYATCDAIANVCAASNGYFDRLRFMRATGAATRTLHKLAR